MTGRERERGAALVVTLIFAAGMAAAAVGFLEARQSDALALRAQVQAVRADALLRSALLETGALLANRTPRQTIPPSLTWPFGEAVVTVKIEAETGKIDLNAAEESLLQALPLALGMADDQAAAFAQTILDWRDENTERRTSGAEDRDYQLAEQGASGAADRPLANPAEIRYLPSVSPALWARLQPLVTIYSGTPQPNQLKASATVRRAMAVARGLSGQKDDAQENESADTSGTNGAMGDDGAQGLGSSSGFGSDGASASGRGSSFGNGNTGLGRNTSGSDDGSSSLGRAGTGLGTSSSGSGFGSGTASSLGSSDTESSSAQATTDDPALEDGGGTHTLLLEVRFPNGYQAAARAVIGLRQGGAGAGSGAGTGSSVEAGNGAITSTSGTATGGLSGSSTGSTTGGAGGGNASPFLVLDWTPILREQGAPP